VTVPTSALVRDLEALHDRLQVAPPPRVARRLRALIHEALGLLDETRPHETPSRTVRVPLTAARAAGYAPPELEALSPSEAAAVFADARRRGRKVAASVYEFVGPVLSPAEVASRLGVTRATVHNWRRAGRLLALHPNQHTFLYPAFQFVEPTDSDNGLLVGLAEVLETLGETSPLGKALWFQARQPSLEGRTPVEVLRRERQKGLGSVLAAAAAAYAQRG
jgi:hypothetical protein